MPFGAYTLEPFTSAVSGDGCILVKRTDYDALIALRERAEMKIRQLERDDCDDIGGGIGTGLDKEHRAAYIKALRWAIRRETGEI